jgi:hypothetical protein
MDMFELDVKTGVLALSQLANASARLWIRRGRIVAAELEGGEALSDEERI